MRREETAVLPQKKERDGGIELLRVYACVMVVWAHIQLNYVTADGALNMTSLVIKALIADNVPIFFLIAGFYLFQDVQGQDRIAKIPGVFGRKLKGFLTHTYIPTVLVTMLALLPESFSAAGKISFRFLPSKVVSWFGSMTFYIFMLHVFMLRYCAPVGDRIRSALDGGLIFSSSLLLGIPCRLLYDRSCRGIGRLWSAHISRKKNRGVM